MKARIQCAASIGGKSLQIGSAAAHPMDGLLVLIVGIRGSRRYGKFTISSLRRNRPAVSAVLPPPLKCLGVRKSQHQARICERFEIGHYLFERRVRFG